MAYSLQIEFSLPLLTFHISYLRQLWLSGLLDVTFHFPKPALTYQTTRDISKWKIIQIFVTDLKMSTKTLSLISQSWSIGRWIQEICTQSVLCCILLSFVSVHSQYLAVSFVQRPCKRRPISRPQGRGTGCLFWIHCNKVLTYSFLYCVEYWVILYHNIYLKSIVLINCTPITQGNFTGTPVVIQLPWCQWSIYYEYR